MQFYEKQIDEAIKALNKAGVSMADVPENIRRETFNLEPKMMAAEKKGDVVAYMAIVAKWRDLFMACKPKSKIEENKKGEIKPWQKKQKQQNQSLTNSTVKTLKQSSLFPI